MRETLPGWIAGDNTCGGATSRWLPTNAGARRTELELTRDEAPSGHDLLNKIGVLDRVGGPSFCQKLVDLLEKRIDLVRACDGERLHVGLGWAKAKGIQRGGRAKGRRGACVRQGGQELLW